MIPFWGTGIGAAFVFLAGRHFHPNLQRGLTGFAAGVMTAASVWSLLIPAMERWENRGRLAFIPAVGGFWLGVLFLLLLDRSIPHFPYSSDRTEGPVGRRSRTAMLVLAVVLHNIPEGMAVGAAFAGWLAGTGETALTAAMVLSLGIAIQNIPEGAIISLPLRAEGMGPGRAFLFGVLSGAVEPVGAALTILAARMIIPALPWLLGFAAGAMICVVVAELIPEMGEGTQSDLGALMFTAGFTVMMALDVAFG